MILNRNVGEQEKMWVCMTATALVHEFIHHHHHPYQRQHHMFHGNLCVNTCGPKRNGRHFADDNFKCILFNDKFGFRSLNFVPFGSNWQEASINSNNDFAPKRRQSIFLTNYFIVYSRIYASHCFNESIYLQNRKALVTLNYIKGDRIQLVA